MNEIREYIAKYMPGYDTKFSTVFNFKKVPYGTTFVGIEFYLVGRTIYARIDANGKTTDIPIENLLQNRNQVDSLYNLFLKKGLITQSNGASSLRDRQFLILSVLNDHFGLNRPPYDIILKRGITQINRER